VTPPDVPWLFNMPTTPLIGVRLFPRVEYCRERNSNVLDLFFESSSVRYRYTAGTIHLALSPQTTGGCGLETSIWPC
jgi:hypothetical protein